MKRYQQNVYIHWNECTQDHKTHCVMNARQMNRASSISGWAAGTLPPPDISPHAYASKLEIIQASKLTGMWTIEFLTWSNSTRSDTLTREWRCTIDFERKGTALTCPHTSILYQNEKQLATILVPSVSGGSPLTSVLTVEPTNLCDSGERVWKIFWGHNWYNCQEHMQFNVADRKCE